MSEATRIRAVTHLIYHGLASVPLLVEWNFQSDATAGDYLRGKFAVGRHGVEGNGRFFC